MKVKSEREVTQSCPTLSDPMDYSLPGSSVLGIFQARVLEWGAIAFSGRKVMTNLDSIFKSRDMGTRVDRQSCCCDVYSFNDCLSGLSGDAEMV